MHALILILLCLAGTAHAVPAPKGVPVHSSCRRMAGNGPVPLAAGSLNKPCA